MSDRIRQMLTTPMEFSAEEEFGTHIPDSQEKDAIEKRVFGKVEEYIAEQGKFKEDYDWIVSMPMVSTAGFNGLLVGIKPKVFH